MSQCEKKSLYNKTAEKYKLDEELVTEIGDSVFEAWSQWQKHPDNLRLKIKNLGVQIVRKKKVNEEIDDMYRSAFDYIEEANNSFTGEDQYMRYKDDQAWYQQMVIMRDIYKQYTADKQKIRELRNALQKPLNQLSPSDIQQRKPTKTSKDVLK